MKVFIQISLLLVSLNAISQITIQQEVKFIEHMVNQGDYNDAIYYIDKINHPDYPFPIRDSLNYLKGWSYYSLKELSLSVTSFLNVSKSSVLFLKSRFFAAYNKSHLGIIPTSDYILKNLETKNQLEGLKYFELSGNALLNRDYNDFERLMNKIPKQFDFGFSNEKQKFYQFADELKNRKRKRLWIGGAMSAIIPGSGKIYAGKTGEGISSFIIVAASGLTAIENYNKLGANHAKTIIFGSLFAVLYVGNIYGSVFTVKLVNEEFNHEMDHKILFNMHIPLRNIFN